ncbi:MAG: hypothetical protein II530_00310 [Bacteroidaceae bacterium]|nr:hypothetical protein [Bacteroidaceae bacterium]
MLNELLKHYSATKILFEVEGKDSTQESVQILRQIEDVLKKNEWKITSSSVENNSLAMMAFFEMSVREIGGDIPALLCYYYSSLVANDSSLPVNIRANGYRFRAFVEFKNMDKWNIIMSMAQAPFNGYEGNLTESEFFDILLLSDVYKAWDSDPSSSMLSNLQKQAPKVASLHPSFSRSQVLSEGELAHKALFDVIEPIVKKL